MAGSHVRNEAGSEVDPSLVLLFVLPNQTVREETGDHILGLHKGGFCVSGKPSHEMVVTLHGGVGHEADDAFDDGRMLS